MRALYYRLEARIRHLFGVRPRGYWVCGGGYSVFVQQDVPPRKP